ncbi:MAG: trypsin-like peptidase domain-containing protein [Lachnospiraceae bacterium]|nr:trypsin-like peptidase domain-containing protein [Lachnospiraceae bacterium]
MNEDRYQKNHNNTPLLVLIVILTLLILAGGIYLGVGAVRYVINRTGLVAETESETAGSDASAAEEAEESAQSSGTFSKDIISGEDSLSERVSSARSSTDVVAVVKKAMPSIVAVTNKSVQEVSYMYRGTMEIESESSGSGFIIGENDTELLIATNYHVIADASTLTVCFSVETENEESAMVTAVVKGTDEEYDLAVLAVALEDIPDEVLEQISIAQLGSSSTLVVGEAAIAIGNALGYGQSVTSGIVSALNRTIEVDGVTGVYIQTDAAINAGNSGGTLLNADGEVIGINSAKVSASGVEGMGYAIPIDEAQPILAQLMERETRERAEESEQAYLGVYTQDISAEARELYDIPSGVYITFVESGSPAEEAGLQKGDIISAMDGVNVSSTDGFEDLLTYYRAYETVTMEILTSVAGTYTAKTVSVTFSAQPEEDGAQERTAPYNGKMPLR